MTPADHDRITQYLRRWSDGSDDALEEMLPHVYAELRTIASRYRRRERGGTLQTTEIINEAYLRLSAQNGIDWKDRSHFFAVAARIIELRYFGGLSADETAAVIGVSEITVKREWLKAKAWLYRDLSGR